MRFLPSFTLCLAGTKYGRRQVRTPQRVTRCCASTGPARSFGWMNLRTRMWKGCGKAGSEPHFLGHQYFYLFVRGFANFRQAGERIARENVESWRSAFHLGADPWGNPGQAVAGRQYQACKGVSIGGTQCSDATDVRRCCGVGLWQIAV